MSSPIYNRIFNPWKKLKIRTKLIFSHMALVLVTITVISIVLVNILIRSYIDEVGKTDVESLNQISKSVTMLLDGIIEKVTMFHLDADVVDFLSQTHDLSTDEFRSYTRTVYENAQLYLSLKSKITQYSAVYSTFKCGIVLVTPRNQQVTLILDNEHTTSSYSPFNFMKYMGEWNEYFADPDNGFFWMKIPDTESITFQASHNTDTFACVSIINSLSTHETYGYIVVGFDSKSVSQCYSNYLSRKPFSKIYIFDQKGEVLSSNDDSSNNIMNLLNIDTLEMFRSHEGTFTRTVNNQDSLLSYSKIPDSEWTILNVVPTTNVLTRLSAIFAAFIIMFAVCFLITLLLSYLFSSGFSFRLSRLQNAMSIAYNESFKNKVAVDSYDEIGDLTQSFNSMIDMVNQYMHQIINAQENKRLVELDFLQAQINSHFLYNVLNSIKILARLNKNDDIRILVTSLVKFLKATIDNKYDIIQIKDELENIYNYIQIQQIMHLKNIRVNVDCSDELMGCCIPKLLLQPIVENAILHGLQFTDTEGIIDIHITNQGEILHISITDNGVGMDDHEIANIMQRKKINKIGLINVDERIKLYYGKEHGIVIESKKNVGTQVSLSFPCVVSDVNKE